MTLEQIVEKAVQYFDDGYNCSQAVFKAFQDNDNGNGLKDVDETLFAGFGAGFAGKGSVCGTLSAATAIISYYRIDRNDPKNRKALYEQLRNFYKDFESIYGSINCKEIIKADFTTPEGFALYKNEKHEKVCKSLVRNVARKVYEYSFDV